jgi:hypothetical protein
VTTARISTVFPPVSRTYINVSEDDMDATVEIVVTGRNVDISDHYRLLITQKLDRLERYNENVSRYDV